MSSDAFTTRERILKSTWSALLDSSKPRVRMSDIANSAGISRQALYLHFANRTELLLATTHYIDKEKHIDHRLAFSRGASSGLERLEAFVDAWGNYIPEIYGVANALIVMGITDESARHAWTGRLAAVREGCEAIVVTLSRDDQLSDSVSPTEATDILCAHLSLETWRYLRHTRGWNQTRYLEVMQHTLRKMLVRQPTSVSADAGSKPRHLPDEQQTHFID